MLLTSNPLHCALCHARGADYDFGEQGDLRQFRADAAESNELGGSIIN